MLVAAAAAAVLAVVSAAGSPAAGASKGSSLASNPELDPGTSLKDARAPGFTLTDQTGRRVSLSQFRGKVVLLAFNDAVCTTVCPLTTSAMLDAKRELGAAGKQVQLLGIDANPQATSVEDVLSYTEVHGLTGSWHFLTGSSRQLHSVWRAYGIASEIVAGQIDHTPALFVIDPHGRMRKVFLTQSSYAAIPQLGQLLARVASKLLPGHPPVRTHLSYRQIGAIGPQRSDAIPRLGGGTVQLGPGAAHLYVFFATWDRQSMPLAAQLQRLNRYVRAARRLGLPGLTAVDEGSVEPSTGALPAFVRSLSQPLTYPVAIDSSGRVADGYDVQGEPWFVLVSPAGRIVWYQTSGWPSLSTLEAQVRGALSKLPKVPSSERQELAALSGSPPPLAALHAQATQLLGGISALRARIHALRGYPIVLNAWASWCTACQAEFGLLASAAARYGKRVAFIGADTEDPSPQDARAFLAHHFVSYPSYVANYSELTSIYPPGLNNLPMTFFLNASGKIVHVNIGEYASQGSLDRDIQAYALAR